MLETKTTKKLAVIFLILVFSFSAVSFSSITQISSAQSDNNQWQDYNNYIVIDQDTIWNGHIVYDDPEKPVVLVNGATLTIEKGTTVELLELDVFDGKIIAEGTESEKIIFTKAIPDFSEFPPNFNSECSPYQHHGIIEFNTWVENETEASSFFRYVEFVNMGTYKVIDNSQCGFTMRNKQKKFHLFNTALADTELYYNPAFKFRSGRVKIENSQFKNNSYADIEVDADNYEGWPMSYLQAVNSNFSGNQQNTALISNSVVHPEDGGDSYHNGAKVILKNNWYGDSNGPKQAPDYLAGGEIIKGDYALDGWSAAEHQLFSPGASNVLFLPGIKASRLYDDEDSSCTVGKTDKKRLWEPLCNEDVKRLYLDKDGNSLDADIHTNESDVINKTPAGSNIYESFIGKMNEMKDSQEINDWKAAAYDWRLSLDDILDDGSIIETLRGLAENSKSRKVTIVAHSNGGLLVKALTRKLGGAETQKLVDKIIFVAVPQVGTPAAIAGTLHGYKQNFFPILDSETARGLAENMPAAYNLLPSKEYFSTVETPVISFDADSSPDWKDRYADEINSEEELHEFLADDFRRVSAANSNVDVPAKLNENLLNKAEDQHADLDEWTAPEGVKLVQIAGWGVPATLSGTEYDVERGEYCDSGLCQTGVDILDPDFKFTIDGDGTVVAPSALWMKDTERFWVNIRNYNKDSPFETFMGLLGIDHSNILEIPELNNFISDIIIGKTKPLSDYTYLSTETPSSDDKKRLQYSLHSPLTLDLYDDQNRHTGVAAGGNVEEQIPGTYFRQFGDAKYIFADEEINARVVMNGYAAGNFTFSAEEFQGDDSLGKITFKDIPTTPETKVAFNIPDNFESASNLRIDQDGDGAADIELKPKIGAIVVWDTIPPTTNISLSGTQGKNGWYASDVSVVLSAEDNEDGAGVEKTEYSLDNGASWNIYADSFAVLNEGIAAVQYFSADKAGNIEETKTATVKIDKTPPEAKIIFNSQTQKLDILGMDNLSQNVSVIIEENAGKNGKNSCRFFICPWPKEKEAVITATLADEAGRETEIILKKKKDKNNFMDVSLESVYYNGQEAVIPENKLQYKWRLDRKKKKYLLFASRLKTGSASLESHYFPGMNQTWIMERTEDLTDDGGNDNAEKRPVVKKVPGMAIPGIISDKGELKIIY